MASPPFLPMRPCRVRPGKRLRPCVAIALVELIVLLLLCAVASVQVARAQDTTARPVERSLADGILSRRAVRDSGPADLQHGEDIVLGRASCGADQTCGCLQCHQLQGEGSARAGFPRVGGQSYLYLYESLRNFAAGRRVSQTMQPIASHLSDDDMRDVAAYYASLSPKQTAAGASGAGQAPDPDAVTQGGVLAAVGSADDGVQACQNCHGPAGAGLPPVYPFLGGQYAGYLEDQLRMFRSGKRRGDAFGVMQRISRRLSDKQIHAVAEYYGLIRPQRTVIQSKLGPAIQFGAPVGPAQRPNGGTSGQGTHP